jgi:hypothetical protein
MSSSRSALTATMMFLSMGFVLYPQGPANAAKFCAQLSRQPQDILTAHFRRSRRVARA